MLPSLYLDSCDVLVAVTSKFYYVYDDLRKHEMFQVI